MLHVNDVDDPDGKYGYYKSACTGALITPPEGANGHFILTAAHCFWNHDLPDKYDNYLQPDPNHKKWRPEVDKMSFQFGVLKQGELVGDAVDIKIEKVMIPKAYTHFDGFTYHHRDEDIAVVKLKSKPPDQWNHPFEVHKFIDSKNEVGTPPKYQDGAEYKSPGYGSRRTMRVSTLHLMNKKKLTSNGRIQCFGYNGPGDSGAPLLKEFRKNEITEFHIVGVQVAGWDPPTVRNEERDENDNIKFFQVKDLQPDIVPITKTRFNLINDMMKGQYDDKKVEIKTFGARVAHYDDGLSSIFCTFLFPINVCDQKCVVHSKCDLNITY